MILKIGWRWDSFQRLWRRLNSMKILGKVKIRLHLVAWQDSVFSYCCSFCSFSLEISHRINFHNDIMDFNIFEIGEILWEREIQRGLGTS